MYAPPYQAVSYTQIPTRGFVMSVSLLVMLPTY